MLPALFQVCMACHGANGVSGLPEIPSLAAQPAAYVAAQLTLFKNGQRKDERMSPMAATLSDADVRSLGEAIEKLAPPAPSEAPLRRERYEKGKAVVAREHCDSCHQPDFSGIETAPRLADQREDYLRKALLDFRNGVRVGFGEPVMPAVARALSEAEIAALAHYLSHLNSASGS